MDINSIYLLLAGLVILVLGANLLLKSAVSISLKFNVPRLLIGLTVVSLATSAPELIISIKSALIGSPDLAISNVVGSNIANIGLVMGLTILFSPINITKDIYNYSWPILMFSAIYFFIIISDKTINNFEGVILIIFLIITISFLIKNQHNNEEEVDLEVKPVESMSQSFLYLIVGGFFLYLGSDWFISGAIDLAITFGVSERIIGITIVSIGTSIPELATSMIAAYNKEKSISIGNLLGSNIFNVFAVLGITSIISPLTVNDVNIVNFDIYVMLFFSAIILPLIFFPKKFVLGRVEGLMILSFYLGYIYYILM
jgi:cation:H+ antiporter|tara:strand:- start:46617 stop:47558 length:942 start_codon:yes stop_codon:yes gene_type:complete